MESYLLFIKLIIIFAVIYFVIALPVFQAISRQVKGRKFVIRLGAPWQFNNSEHRWDVFMSVISFMLALGIAMFLFDYFYPFAGN